MEDQNQFRGFPCESRFGFQAERQADGCKTHLQVEEAVQKTSRRTCGGTQRAAASALCFKPLRTPADLSGDGCRGQGWGHPPRHVGDQSAGLRCRELQATKWQRTGTRLSLALNLPAPRTRADRDL